MAPLESVVFLFFVFSISFPSVVLLRSVAVSFVESFVESFAVYR
jgi:hypothetical protein